MWADNENKVDLLNVGHLVTAISETVREPNLLPATIGVFGGWGRGKSTLMHLIRKELEEDPEVLCVTFNGWLFESYDDAKSALMGTILEEIRAKRTPVARGKELLGKLTRRVDWFRTMSLAGKGALTLALGGPAVIAGVGAAVEAGGGLLRMVGKRVAEADPGEMKEMVGAYVKGAPEEDEPTQTIRGFRDDFVELLNETRVKTLVVFIDELDRCLPNAVVETLEAIRLFLFVERTAFIIGADEELVEQAVRYRFQHEGMSPQIGTRYLEKMIQIPFRIPPMGSQEIEAYMNLLFAQLHCESTPFEELVVRLPERVRGPYGEVSFTYEDARELLSPCPPELPDRFVLTAQLAPVLTRGLSGNPRQVKRFLNMLLLRLRLAKLRKIELSTAVLGKLMLLEYFRREHFLRLADWQATQSGRPTQIQALEAALAEEARPSEPDAAEESEPENKKEASGPKRKRGAAKDERSSKPLLPEEVKDWPDDPWLRSWAEMQPQFFEVDLGAYFFIAREQTGTLSSPLVQISPAAQEALNRLRNTAESVRNAGVAALGSLPPGDISGIFQTLAAEIRRAEVLGQTSVPPLASILALVSGRSDMAGELTAFFGSIPEIQIPIGLPPAFWRVVKDTPAQTQGQALLQRWARSQENGRLATAATIILSTP